MTGQMIAAALRKKGLEITPKQAEFYAAQIKGGDHVRVLSTIEDWHRRSLNYGESSTS